MVIILHDVPLEDGKRCLQAQPQEESDYVIGIHKVSKLSILLFIIINQPFFLIKLFFVGICLSESKVQDLKNKMMWDGSCLEKYPSEKTHRKIQRKRKRYLFNSVLGLVVNVEAS